MRSRKRRRLDGILSGVAALVVGVVAGIGAAVGDSERIGSLWISARLDTVNGNLAVTEVIDYDFGVQQRHGIYRDVPDLVEGAPITVSSPTAPDDADIRNYSWETRIRIGHPNKTINNRHRYQIDFVIDGSAVDVSSAFSWQAVGTEWTVPIEKTEIWLALPFEIGQVNCEYGNQFGQLNARRMFRNRVWCMCWSGISTPVMGCS